MKNNTLNGLDIYAKVEDLLGMESVSPKLYEYYSTFLNVLEFQTLLDIGCGSGVFLDTLRTLYPQKDFFGIDKSYGMVQKALNLGINAQHTTIDGVTERYDIATATFDMLNYLSKEELQEFFNSLTSVIKPGGFFLFDLNSEFGLSELAVGNFIAQDATRFVTIESDYKEGIYDSEFNLFEKEGKNYKRYTGKIEQYLHKQDFFDSLGGWEIKSRLPIKLYDMQDFDKIIYILQRT